MSIISRDDRPFRGRERTTDVQTFQSTGLPRFHPAEADVFARQLDVPGHRQDALDHARVLVVGAGGLGSWTGLALIRSGVRHLTIVEPDVFERTNMTRQLMFTDDVGQPKAIAVARNLAPHAPAPAQITAIPFEFQEAVRRFALPADVVVVLVDNNACRLAGAQFARRRGIPAVFAMLSADAMRAHMFLQGSRPTEACVHCALPNLDPDGSMPCVSAIITSCLLAASYTTFLVHRALMGWADGLEPYNWREADLFGSAPERVGYVSQRAGCPTCLIV